MKKIYMYFVIIMLFLLIPNANAKTLSDLKKQLIIYEQEITDAKSKQLLKKNDISNINARIKNISDKIQNDEKEIKITEDEIRILENKIKEKEKQIKSAILYLLYENSDNSFFKYIFNTNSIEDLILKNAISEQVIAYNLDVINDYNKKIKEYRLKSNDLRDKITNLNMKQENLNIELNKLGDSLSDTANEMVSIDSQIDAQKKLIDYYENTLGCMDDQDINTCEEVPSSSDMKRPLISGAISSEFGYRLHPTQNVYKLHSGIDMYGATDVYAVAPGTVAGVSWKNSCGGTMLFIHHHINGRFYTSTYAHLYQVKVKVGDYVQVDTPIAVTGGSKLLTPWDSCTTGRHLHLSIANGLYLQDYTSWNTYISKLINPRTMINFPKIGIWFSNRTKLY